MAVKAECTWGEGPDVLVVVGHTVDDDSQGFSLVSHGIHNDNSSFGLSAPAARRLAAQLIVAAEKAEAYDRSYENYARDEKAKRK